MGNKSGKEREALRQAEEEERLRQPQSFQNPSHPSESLTQVISEEEQFDAGERFIRDKGCWEHYISALKCISKQGDWSKCPDEAKILNICLANSYIQDPTAHGTKTA